MSVKDSLFTTVENRVTTLTLNRPEAYNTLTVEMLDALPPLLDQLSDDDQVRCVVITGAGNKAFCAGGDISGLVTGDDTVDRGELSERLITWGRASGNE